jgi:SpoVK/Ycf46/Vps4 family AAA+-type ATPase
MCQSCYTCRQSCPGGHDFVITRTVLPSLEMQMNKMNLGGRVSSKSEPSAASGEGINATRTEEEEQLRDSLIQSIVSEKPNIKWEDVAGLESGKEELQGAVVLPLKFP